MTYRSSWLKQTLPGVLLGHLYTPSLTRTGFIAANPMIIPVERKQDITAMKICAALISFLRYPWRGRTNPLSTADVIRGCGVGPRSLSSVFTYVELTIRLICNALD